MAFCIAGCQQDVVPGAGGVGTPDETDASTEIAESAIEVTVEPGATILSQFDHDPNHLLVQVIPGSLADADEIATRVGAGVQSFNAATRTATLLVAPEKLNATAARLVTLPEVEQVEKDYLLPVAAVPSDADFFRQWHLSGIEAEAAWDISSGDPNVIVAIVDTGVDVNHPDLRARVSAGYNFVTSTPDANDCCGHGTEVAGTVSAIGNNGLGVAGVTWQGTILPVRVAANIDGRQAARLSDIARGIIWATDHGAAVINTSFTGLFHSTTVRNAAQYALLSGSLVVASMGNTGQRDGSAGCPWIIGVSAADESDNLAGFSTFGPGVDLAAPGVDIYTTERFGGYGFASGTSFSSPIVAGVIALMRSVRPDATPSQITDLLFASADDVGPPGADELFGHGRVNARAAVTAARDAALPPDATPPQVAVTAPVDGAGLTGKTRFEIDARDDALVREVVLSVDGVELARDPSFPYAFLIDSQAAPPGNHRVTATATDVAGNRSGEASITVSFNPGTDTTPPDVALLSPSSGDRLHGPVTISARLVDAGGLSRVSVALDGVVIATRRVEGPAARIDFKWNASAPGVRPGDHALDVIVLDRANLSETATVAIGTE